MMDDRSFSASSYSGKDDLVDRFSALWRSEQRPDLDAFLDQAGTLSPLELASLVRIDQVHRGQLGERISAEEYLTRYPDLRRDPDAAIDLIYGEFLLAESLGDHPKPDDFLERFPEYADTLRPRMELHRTMQTKPQSSASTALETRVVPGHATDFGAEPPREFGRYRIIKPIGSGGMGTVYLAHDTQLDRQVALKVPRFGKNPESDVIARFYREARIAANFSHPLLCPVFDVGEHGGIHYLTMPLLRGEVLSAKLKSGGSLPENEAARITARMARALAVAHRASVIHRDLKPANILLGEDGEPIIMDFGLARRNTEIDPHLTTAGELFGTPAYMPPELIGGNASSAGPVCDVYSLGVIFYQTLTGRVPFDGTTHEVLRKALTAEPEPPSHHVPGIHPHLDAICRKASAKDPGARYKSMDDFADALERHLRFGDSPEPTWRRSRPPALKLGFVAVTIILFAIAISAMLRRGPATVVIPPDPLSTGSVWRGTFRFRPPLQDISGDVSIEIKERRGERVRADYVTEGGRYRWEIEGSLHFGAFQCGFTKEPPDSPSHNVVGLARLEGTVDANRMTLVFTQTEVGVADLTLDRAER